GRVAPDHRTIDQELHFRHADVIRRVGLQRYGAGDGLTATWGGYNRGRGGRINRRGHHRQPDSDVEGRVVNVIERLQLAHTERALGRRMIFDVAGRNRRRRLAVEVPAGGLLVVLQHVIDRDV